MNDYTYRLEEMANDMEVALNNIDKVIESQSKLNKVILDSNEAQFFESFVKDSQENINQYMQQKEKLHNKKTMLNSLLEDVKGNELVKEAVFKLMIITGLAIEE